MEKPLSVTQKKGLLEPKYLLFTLDTTFFAQSQEPYSFVYHKTSLSESNNSYLPILLDTSTETEIDELRSQVIANYHILEFNVPVWDVTIVEIFQRVCELSHNGPTVRLWKALIRLTLKWAAQWDPRQVFHDDIQVVIGLNNIVDAYNIWMVE